MIERKMVKIWWIRWNDGSMNTCSGTYECALAVAKAKGIGFRII